MIKTYIAFDAGVISCKSIVRKRKIKTTSGSSSASRTSCISWMIHTAQRHLMKLQKIFSSLLCTVHVRQRWRSLKGLGKSTARWKFKVRIDINKSLFHCYIFKVLIKLALYWIHVVQSGAWHDHSSVTVLLTNVLKIGVSGIDRKMPSPNLRRML